MWGYSQILTFPIDHLPGKAPHKVENRWASDQEPTAAVLSFRHYPQIFSRVPYQLQAWGGPNGSDSQLAK